MERASPMAHSDEHLTSSIVRIGSGIDLTSRKKEKRKKKNEGNPEESVAPLSRRVEKWLYEIEREREKERE